MKRFYSIVSLEQTPKGFSIKLDGKSAKTPSGKMLLAQTKDIANAMADEWRAQKDKIDPQSMPITQLEVTKIDFIEGRQQEAIQDILEYIDSDLILYQADKPDGLVERQNQHWRPWIEWMGNNYMVHYEVTHDLNIIKQAQSIHDFVQSYVRKLSLSELLIFYILVNASKSIILAIAFIEGEASAQDVYQAACINDIYKQDFYKDIDPDTKRAHQSIQDELNAARKYLKYLQT